MRRLIVWSQDRVGAVNNLVALAAHGSLRASASRRGGKKCKEGSLAELLPNRLQVKGLDQSDLDELKARGLKRRVGQGEKVRPACELIPELLQALQKPAEDLKNAARFKPLLNNK